MDIINWRIIVNRENKHIRMIESCTGINIPREAYNYDIYTPIVLAPINRSSTLILSEYDDDGALGLKIHDMRIVGEEIVSSITFNLRGSSFHLTKLKSELNRVCDKDRCIGISYFLRKIYYTGFSTLYVPKILKPKVNGSLERAKNVIKTVMMTEIKSEEELDER